VSAEYTTPTIIRTCEPLRCCDEKWEAAYAQFESPEQEVRKFRHRLLSLGAAGWPRNSRIVDLFCGRGNGLLALQHLGFQNVTGVDLSERLLEQFRGPGTLYLADCRRLPFDDATCDLVIVQGGLHHLPGLTSDLEQVLREVRRVLRRDGRFVAVEPWLTPYLRVVHAVCGSPFRRAWRKLDALATMIERERETYEAWLERPREVLECFDREFQRDSCVIAWGKLNYVGVNSRAA
jgi:SAM-dependent methyltransferase